MVNNTNERLEKIQVKSIDELVVGGTYMLDAEVYTYGGIVQFGNGTPYAFVCDVGTYFLNKAALKNTIESNRLWLLKK